MRDTLTTGLLVTSLWLAGRYPTRTRILGSHRKERDPDTRNHHHRNHHDRRAVSNRGAA